jgi:hypothetical protein
MRRTIPTNAGAFALCVLLTLIPSCNGGPPPPTPKIPKVLIWCDVTGSLKKSESVQVAEISANLLDLLPDDAEFVVNPIHMQTETPKPIIESEPPGRALAKISDTVKDQRRQAIKKRIEELYPAVNDTGQPRERTCILNTLRFNQRYFAGLDREKYEPFVIYISDMVEHCAQTPLGRPVNLVGAQPQNLQQLVEGFSNPPNLSDFNLFVIIPTAKETSTVPLAERPALDIRRSFWDAAFRKCGVKEETLQSMGWLPSIPTSLRDSLQKTKSAGR